MQQSSPYIMQILRTSFHDGDGLRTVVYFKGCPLKCIWCHNPEGQRVGYDVFYYEHKCIKCGRCLKACKNHTVKDDKMVFDRDNCTMCGKCAKECPSGALTLCGNNMSPEELFAVIKRDKDYYDRTGGGVTFSGGEALLYSDYLAHVMEKCKLEGIRIAVESAMYVDKTAIEKLLPYVNDWMVDIKHMDDQIHRRLTGKGNKRILENIEYLAKQAPKYGATVLARTPLIPGCNDDMENLSKTAQFAFACKTRGLQLLKYNNLGQVKYTQLGGEILFDGKPQANEHIVSLCNELNTNLSEGFVFFKP